MNIATPENPRAVIGGNNPPPSPFEIAQKAVDDVYDEAKLWLDGAKVDSQALADGIGNLLAELRKAGKVAEENRKTEKKVHDDAAKAVQEQYKPLLEKIDRATDACKKALQPWLVKIEEEKREAARKAQEEADRKKREAEEALRASDAANLGERAKAEALLKDAKKAEKTANAMSKQTATAGGSMGRSVGLRTIWTATMTDPVAASRHYWGTAQGEITAFVQGLADRDVRNGVRTIPGFEIKDHKEAV